MTDSNAEKAPSLPDRAHLGAVYLRVRDLEQVTRFYQTVIGLQLLPSADGSALLGAGGKALVGLIAAPDAPAAGRAPGLYHLAVLLPDRAQLGAFLQHSANVRARLQGAADHGVSEALYLADPEGNGVEVYRDRPKSEWPVGRGGVEMITATMDAEGVLEAGAHLRGEFTAPPETLIGHVHLRVSSLDAALAHYNGVIGLDVTQASYPGALFTSAGGYHHHVGMNTWGTAGKPAPEHGSLGLEWFELVVPEEGARVDLEKRLAANSEVRDDESTAFPARVYYDSDGIGVAVTAG